MVCRGLSPEPAGATLSQEVKTHLGQPTTREPLLAQAAAAVQPNPWHQPCSPLPGLGINGFPKTGGFEEVKAEGRLCVLPVGSAETPIFVDTDPCFELRFRRIPKGEPCAPSMSANSWEIPWVQRNESPMTQILACTKQK